MRLFAQRVLKIKTLFLEIVKPSFLTMEMNLYLQSLQPLWPREQSKYLTRMGTEHWHQWSWNFFLMKTLFLNEAWERCNSQPRWKHTQTVEWSAGYSPRAKSCLLSVFTESVSSEWFHNVNHWGRGLKIRRIEWHVKLNEAPISVSINKFYWNMAMFFCLLVPGCFCALNAELCNFDRDHRVCKGWNIYIWLKKKKLVCLFFSLKMLKQDLGVRSPAWIPFSKDENVFWNPKATHQGPCYFFSVNRTVPLPQSYVIRLRGRENKFCLKS